MEMVMRRSFLSVILFLMTSAAAAFGQDSTVLGTGDGQLRIAWEPAGGAAAYRVEIRRDGQVFIDTETPANELNLDLAPGAYEYRIRVLNPFGGEVSASSWQDLQVERARIPYFRVIDPPKAWEGDTTVTMEIEVVDIRDKLEFRLARDGRDVPVLRRETGGPDSLQADITGLDPGDWDLIARAPSGLVFTHPGALVIRPKRAPEVSSIDTSELPNSGLAPIVLDGDAFDEDMTVAFRGPGGYLKVAALEVSEGREARIYLDLDGAKAGNYDLVATNPAGEKFVREGALTIVEPEIPERERIQPRFEFHIGWAPFILDAPDETIPCFAAIDVALAFQSGTTIPFLRGLGVEAHGVVGLTGPTDYGRSSMDYAVMYDLAGYWRPSVRGRAAPVLLMGVGNMWTGYADYYGLPNIIYIRTGVGIDFAKYTNFTRIGLNLSFAFTDNETLPMLSLSFRRGFRF